LVTIGTNPKQSALLEAEFHEFDFVAGRAIAFVAPGEDGDALAFREKSFGEPDDHGCLSGAADCEVADTDDRAIESFLFEYAFGIEPDAQTSEVTIKHRSRPEQETQPWRKIHRTAPPR